MVRDRGQIKKIVASAPVEKDEAIHKIVNAMKEMEGYYPGSLSYENNNVCNIRAVGDLGWNKGFGKFSTYKKGVDRCIRTIKWYANAGSTLEQMIHRFAPEEDSNNPSNYTHFVASKTGIDPKSKLNTLF